MVLELLMYCIGASADHAEIGLQQYMEMGCMGCITQD